ncbi:heme ABC exporter ATP-binding protein CcmA [Marivirga tractuosa]|uniref:ABC transporter related protein n=1 Tax=Marivirga tractuosa (strain ATCC 23168 / DSM 4126 / NBRC 15989 / NCIMB 1408 / VKM B-1430 / H-43) TaxID=643867 RepID=E4TNB3_MARTH|nr:ATP-binding cassette domain-containing protein [Marivirga tractuosa]ADR23501.1 ABC transporter related protein [Marivirga tractuosa DSM 4126]BDD15820.1 heme ABC exporter ATP-binding protein CcmA [Marivirga tractuosa]
MQLILEGLSKKYPKNKLFENLNHTFEINNTYAITGENGSGKSTLIKIIAGVIAPSKGIVKYVEKGKLIDKESIYQILGITAPYLNLIEEFTLKEHLDFHSKFKTTLMNTDIMEEIKKANLIQSLNKPIAEFSSGMQQRLKLILCCSFNAKVLLLDEPTSHLDSMGIEWYKDLINRTSNERITLIASNNPDEYNDFAKKIINIEG